MKEELVDVYDQNRNTIGKIINRKDIGSLKSNEYIITVHCFIINSSNQILLTQRSLNKNRGGKWEETHGGLRAGENAFDEDILCANYIKSLLENNPLNNLEEQINQLKNTTGSKFFDKSKQKDFPERDFYLCTEINKFDFILKVEKDEEGRRYIKKIEV